MPWYSSTSWTVMPIGEPPRQMATRNVGLKPLRTICMASSIESRSSDSAEMNTLSTACEGGEEVTQALLRGQCSILAHPASPRGELFRAAAERPANAVTRAGTRNGQPAHAGRHPGPQRGEGLE